MTQAATVRLLSAREASDRIGELSEILMDCVEGGASVSFMLPFPRAAAEVFWRGVIARVAAGECLLLGAHAAGDAALSGTVQVHLAQPPNQPHRADVAKMLVHRRARRQGLGAALMAAAELAAREAGKTLLVLDTASPDAERLYRRMGWTFCGAIPGYALLPEGGLCDTHLFFKHLSRP